MSVLDNMPPYAACQLNQEYHRISICELRKLRLGQKQPDYKALLKYAMLNSFSLWVWVRAYLPSNAEKSHLPAFTAAAATPKTPTRQLVRQLALAYFAWLLLIVQGFAVVRAELLFLKQTAGGLRAAYKRERLVAMLSSVCSPFPAVNGASRSLCALISGSGPFVIRLCVVIFRFGTFRQPFCSKLCFPSEARCCQLHTLPKKKRAASHWVALDVNHAVSKYW